MRSIFSSKSLVNRLKNAADQLRRKLESLYLSFYAQAAGYVALHILHVDIQSYGKLPMKNVLGSLHGSLSPAALGLAVRYAAPQPFDDGYQGFAAVLLEKLLVKGFYMFVAVVCPLCDLDRGYGGY